MTSGNALSPRRSGRTAQSGAEVDVGLGVAGLDFQGSLEMGHRLV